MPVAWVVQSDEQFFDQRPIAQAFEHTAFQENLRCILGSLAGNLVSGHLCVQGKASQGDQAFIKEE